MPLNKPIFTIMFLIYYLLPFYLIVMEDKNNIHYLCNKILYGFSKNDNYYGSYWCWIVAIFSFIIYLINPYIQPSI